MTMITPATAKTLIAQGARLVDVRGPDEYARSHIPSAVNMPLDALTPLPGNTPVIFHCLTGNRTSVHKDKLAAAAPGAMVMEGGLQAWKAAGLAVETKRGQPIEIMRQVQITAGSLVLLGVVLSHFMPGFIWLSAFIGAGLVFAGASGWCGMAKALKFLPWNRVAG
jgi:rhodanese-related sulfurtransferase